MFTAGAFEPNDRGGKDKNERHRAETPCQACENVAVNSDERRLLFRLKKICELESGHRRRRC